MPAGTWVHFDIETNPLSPSGEEHVYLWGLLLPPYHIRCVPPDLDGQRGGRPGWLDQFLEVIADLRQRHPDLVLAHYADFEVQKIALYAQPYGMTDHPVITWLNGVDSPLFDLSNVVKASLAADRRIRAQGSLQTSEAGQLPVAGRRLGLAVVCGAVCSVPAVG